MRILRVVALVGAVLLAAPGNAAASGKFVVGYAAMNSRLAPADQNSAEEGYEDLLRAIERKPFPSVEALRNAQRLMRLRNPKMGDIKAENIIDGRIMRKLEASGFIDRAYASQGLK